jgi:hypothetical protein
MPGKKIAYVLRTPRSRALAVAVVISAAAAVMVMARQPSQPDVTALDEQVQEAATVLPTPQQAPAPRAQARKTAAASTRPTSAVPATRARSDATTAKATAGADVPAVESVSRASSVESASTAPRVEPASRAPVQEQAAITVTGCLEQDDERFRLKETAGADAPKSRSWRSGFLKKRAASIEVIDAANRLQLPTHVGQRISVTGTLADGEMQVRSLRRVAATCEDDS